MNLIEFFGYELKLPPVKDRNKEFWSVESRPELKSAIEKCLATGMKQIVHDRSELTVWVVTPEWPSLAITEGQGAKEGWLRCSVDMYGKLVALGVEGDVEVPKELGFGECGKPGCRAATGLVNQSFCRSCKAIYKEKIG